jgi:hypothetical protein
MHLKSSWTVGSISGKDWMKDDFILAETLSSHPTNNIFLPAQQR